MSERIFRFAPSPNGELHLGHAFSALTGFRAARRSGARFLLRIEDIDIARCREEYVSGLLEDLAWLGLTWEEPVLRQSRHVADYAEAAGRLDQLGLIYPCFATRSEIAEATKHCPDACDPDGSPLYPGLHKHLPHEEIMRRTDKGELFALRLHMDRALTLARERLGGTPLTFREHDANGKADVIECRPERWGDLVIVRKDAPASYVLAATYDDARQGVTDIVRGADLLAATDVQRLLQVLLELPEPSYSHHPLILDETGRKLSKSAKDTSLRSLRAAGASAADILRLVGLDEGSA
jgi:glutamyl-Q tRNA(Asp) synthetase